MSWSEETKKQVIAKIVAGVLLLISFLAAAVWRDALSRKLEQAMAGWPTKAVAALLALALIVIAIETSSITYLLYVVYRHRRLAKSSPKSLRRYGVVWDEHQNPLCPVCEVLLSLKTSLVRPTDAPEWLHCPKCGKGYTLKSDRNNFVSLAVAKTNIRQASKKR